MMEIEFRSLGYSRSVVSFSYQGHYCSVIMCLVTQTGLGFLKLVLNQLRPATVFVFSESILEKF